MITSTPEVQKLPSIGDPRNGRHRISLTRGKKRDPIPLFNSLIQPQFLAPPPPLQVSTHSPAAQHKGSPLADFQEVVL